MTLHQVRKGGYTHLSNDVLRAGLSARAIGVLVIMLSKPSGWRFASARIAAEVTEGRDAIRTAMRELSDAGFLTRRTVGGETPHTEFYVRDSLDIDWPDGVKSGAWESGPGESGAGSSGREVITDLVTTEEVTTEKDSPTPAPSRAVIPAYPSPFDDWWSLYPRKIGKPVAERAYRARRCGAISEHVLAGLRRWATYWREAGTAVEFIPHPSTWLNQERWNDVPPPVGQARRDGGAADNADLAWAAQQIVSEPDYGHGPGRADSYGRAR